MSGIPAGWYDDGSGAQRWWDGNAWTEDVLRDGPGRSGGTRKPGLGASLQDFGARISRRPDPTEDGDAIWAAVSKPMTGIGGATYKLTTDYLIIEKGMLSSHGRHIRTGDIREVSVSQNLSQKFRGLGSIVVSAHTAEGIQIVMLEDVLDFRQGAVLIGKAANDARSGGSSPTNGRSSTGGARAGRTSDAAATPAGPPSPEDRSSAAMVLNTELLRLAQLHADGVLTDAEFAAAKQKLLGL